ncbi:MAG TPA: hypothetical protein VK607_02435, partial [Kofleriaceae bacterium]|nr:hypothetical protein [Kofleriaceae bacterium]
GMQAARRMSAVGTTNRLRLIMIHLVLQLARDLAQAAARGRRTPWSTDTRVCGGGTSTGDDFS